jgi:acetoin utilization deacetylase AcuC-like enzyme
MVRPPGHHSGLKTQPHGFSFFNNISLAANYLTTIKNVKKIVIVDWDAHHG